MTELNFLIFLKDQFIVQLIRLMDRLLKKENLDLKLTPYNVLATGCVAINSSGRINRFTPSL